MSHQYSINQIFIGHDIEELERLRLFVREQPHPEEGFHKDIYGNKARLEYFYADLKGCMLQNDIPFPDNGQYGEAIEYLGTLRGVQSARVSLVVYELGAGFAPWLVVANGFRKHLSAIATAKYVAVEADPARLSVIRQNFADNGLPMPGEPSDGSETHIVNAAVAGRPGELLFLAKNLQDWGGSLRTEANGTDYRGMDGDTVSVPARRIDDIIQHERRVDLMHIDIQGWETESIAASISALNEKVACLVIGTHSRVIEGELVSLLWGKGWALLYEKPCKFNPQSDLPDLLGATHFDGTQVWINRALWPSDFAWV